MEMEAITRAARLGRTLGESPRQEDKMPFDIFAILAVPLTSSSNSGLQRCRFSGSCHRMECPVLDGQLRTVTDYLAGFEEMLGYIVNSVSTSLG